VMSRRLLARWPVVGGLITVLAVVASLVWWAIAAAAPSESLPQKPANLATATVERQDLHLSQSATGVLGFGSSFEVQAVKTGTITWLPTVGTVVGRGQQLYRVNEEPVLLFQGVTPLYRVVNGSGLQGNDVQTVANNLVALGYLSEFAEGSKTGDEFAVAAQSLRKDKGLPPLELPPTDDSVRPASDGSSEYGTEGVSGSIATRGGIAHSDVYVAPSDVRVEGIDAQLGTTVAQGTILRVTQTAQKVTLDAEAVSAISLTVGASVTLTLPGGQTTTGTVSEIAANAAEGADPARGQPAATIDVDDSAPFEGVESGPITVSLVSETRENVLAVPVAALLALREGGYALETEDGKLVAVTTGLFAGQFVEVSGSGVTEGMVVVTAK